MAVRSPVGRSVLVVLVGISIRSSAWGSELIPPGRYEVTTETSMPHLEENLRYSTTRETRCLGELEFSKAFPILTHPSLEGCQLAAEKRDEEEISYLLVCEGRHGTTGEALWRLGPHQTTGTLRVKLGGKNMTFYQRVTARLLGECASERK